MVRRSTAPLVGGDSGRFDLPRGSDRSGLIYFIVSRLTLKRKDEGVETVDRGRTVPIDNSADFVHWPPVIAGAVVTCAFWLVLIAFGAAIGLSVASTTPTWRDASSVVALLSGLYLVLAAIVAFGVGGYIAGRLRKTWLPSLHHEFARFRDGVHGLVCWGLAVAIGAILATVTATAVTPKTSTATSSPAVSSGESLIAYDLDRLFRSDRRDQGDLASSRAEASRVLLAATGRTGMKPDDRTYLAHLVATRTGIGQPEAERRVDEAIGAATQAVKKARQGAVILGFSVAVSLLLGAAVAWSTSALGAQHRDQTEPPLKWDLSRA